MDYDFSRFAIGGATRPDSFTSMTPGMQGGLWGFLLAAEQELGTGLQVYSGYRSPELQAQLWQGALEKYGSPEAARKWVAPPGLSEHNNGNAADLKFNGQRLTADSDAGRWVAENAARFGLSVPMPWEPWHVELAGARGQTIPKDPPLGFGGQNVGQPAPIAALGQPVEPEAEADPYAQLGAYAAEMAAPSEPLRLAPAPVAQYQPTRRDFTPAYQQFFGRLRG